MIIKSMKKRLFVFIVGMIFAVNTPIWGMDYEKALKIENHARSFLRNTWNVKTQREMMDILKDVPTAELDSIVHYAQQLRTYMGKSSKVGLVKTVTEIPSHERDNFCREINQVLKILPPLVPENFIQFRIRFPSVPFS